MKRTAMGGLKARNAQMPGETIYPCLPFFDHCFCALQLFLWTLVAKSVLI